MVIIERLIEELHEGSHTLIVAKGGEVRRFSGRGVADIHNLLHTAPEFLDGATIVDKIIGKGVAAIMILAKPEQVYTDVMSENALALFTQYDIKVSYEVLTAHIIRRDGNGWCPVEQLCRDESTPEGCLAKIDEFIKQQKKYKDADNNS